MLRTDHPVSQRGLTPPLSPPTVGRVLEITTRIGCKNSCSYCPQETLVRAYSRKQATLTLSFGSLQECLETVPRSVSIYFSGFAEPFLNTECSRMILYAHERGHSIRVYTTMTGMRLSDIEALHTVPFDRFVLHTPDRQERTNIVVDEAYLIVLNTLLSSGIRNLRGVSFGTYGSDGMPPQVNAAFKKARVTLEYPGLTTRAGNLEPSAQKRTRRLSGSIGACDRLHRNILLPNGDVVLCCADFGLQHVIGNLLKDDYEALFASDEFLRIRKGLLDDSEDLLCRRCEWAPTVPGSPAGFIPKVRSFLGRWS